MDTNEAGSSLKRTADESETVMSMGELIKEEDEMIQEAECVLGAGDVKNCTYSQGYLFRQPLYACLSCIPEAKEDLEKAAGVCLACSYDCHDGHNLIELYTKRNFCCDCGNDKYPNFKCNLIDKNGTNEENTYNQNFKGLYCTCSKPYPDPEDPIEDEMSQCTICEDWYHSRHLGVAVPVNYAEMICEMCVKKHEFLLYYDGLTVTKIAPAETSDSINVTDKVEDKETPKDIKNDAQDIKKDEEVKEVVQSDTQEAVKCESREESKGDINPESIKIETDLCKKPKIKSDIITTKFMNDITWREKLCKCSSCMDMYKAEKVLYLLDMSDTVQSYEEKGKANMKIIKEEAEKTMLKSMDRVALVEYFTAYNEFKGDLTEFLKKFAQSKEVLREEHVKEFFSGLQSRKRQKVEIPHFCR